MGEAAWRAQDQAAGQSLFGGRSCQQGGDKSIKHRVLLRGQEVDIAFMVEKERGDPDDSLRQVTRSRNTFGDFFCSFAYQIVELM
jgi:hypothetical protein